MHDLWNKTKSFWSSLISLRKVCPRCLWTTQTTNPWIYWTTTVTKLTSRTTAVGRFEPTTTMTTLPSIGCVHRARHRPATHWNGTLTPTICSSTRRQRYHHPSGHKELRPSVSQPVNDDRYTPTIHFSINVTHPIAIIFSRQNQDEWMTTISQGTETEQKHGIECITQRSARIGNSKRRIYIRNTSNSGGGR